MAGDSQMLRLESRLETGAFPDSKQPLELPPLFCCIDSFFLLPALLSGFISLWDFAGLSSSDMRRQDIFLIKA